MSTLRIYLFGKFNVCYGDEVLVGRDTRKVQEMFCYLLLNRDRPHSREILASLLWDENHAVQPVRCLRKTLWQLRTFLDSQAAHLSERVLLVEPDWVQLNPEADLWLDVATFEDAFARVQAKPGRKLQPEDVSALKSAVDLYRGGLQESWYSDWYLYERERLQHLYLIMLDKLMGFCEAHAGYEAGLAYGTLILRCERAHERTYRRLMRLHYLAGDRTAALRQYEHCVAALNDELGVRPAKRTTTLYERIRSDQFSVASRMLGSVTRAHDAIASPLPEVVTHLKQLQAALAEAQRHLDALFERTSWS